MKRNLNLHSALFALAASITSLHAEVFTQTYTTTQCEDYELITQMLIGPGVARKPVGALIPQTKSYQVGVFSNLVAAVIPTFTNGVILTTGRIDQGASLTNEYSDAYWEGEAVWPYGYPTEYGPDTDLYNYNEWGDLYDQAGIVLYIQPKNKTINIPFVMASEEYYYDSDSPEYPDQDEYETYSDKFVFFLKEIGEATDPSIYDAEGNIIDDGLPMTENIAKLPDGIGDVEISSVNQHTNSQYFVSNVCTNLDGTLQFPTNDLALPMEFNGAIIGPVAVAENVNTGKVYKLKIIVADDYNNMVNSAIFLRDRGITSGADLKIELTGAKHLAAPGETTVTSTVSNIGPATADGVKVKYFLPAGFGKANVTLDPKVGEVKETDWGEEGGRTNFIWTIGDRFAPESNAVMTVKYSLGNGTFENLAYVTTTTGDYDESNNTNQLTITVGALKPSLTVKAKNFVKCYGEALTLGAKDFIGSADPSAAMSAITGLDVVFSNALATAEANPTNKSENVGKYKIYLANLQGIDPDDYSSVTLEAGELQITQRWVTVTAPNMKRAYDETNPTEVEMKAKCTLSEELIEGNTLTYSMVCDYTDNEPGNHIDVLKFKGDENQGNYKVVFVPGDLEIGKIPLKIYVADVAGVVYGSEVPANLGFKEGDQRYDIVNVKEEKIDNLNDVTFGTTYEKGKGIGDYTINTNGTTLLASDYYEIEVVPGKLTVGPKTLTIKARNVTKVYGTDLTKFVGDEWAIVGETLPAGVSITNVTFTCAGGEKIKEIGEYEIAISKALGIGLDNYTFVYKTGKLGVTKFPLAIVAKDVKKMYGEKYEFKGDEFYTIPWEPAELPNGEYVTKVTLTSIAATNAAEQVGIYDKDNEKGVKIGFPIEGTGSFDAKNYNIVFTNAALEVTNRLITIKAKDAKKRYGDVLTFDGTEFEITAGSAATDAGEKVTKVNISSEKAAALKTSVGKYADAITAAEKVEGIKSANYAITFLPGDLEVTNRCITITALDTNKVYGASLVPTGNIGEFKVGGDLLAGEVVTNVHIVCEEATNVLTKAGTYSKKIVPSKPVTGKAFSAANYHIDFVPGTLKVTPAPLTITANPANKVYGTVFTFTGDKTSFKTEGLLNGAVVTSVQLSCAAAGNTKAKAANYSGAAGVMPGHIVLGENFDTNNYAITFAPGVFTVNQAPLTITAKEAKKAYGESKTFKGDEFTYAPATLPNGETVTKVSITGEKAAEVKTVVGKYVNDITPQKNVSGANGFDQNNYALTFVKGDLIVTQALLTVTVNDARWKVKKDGSIEKEAYSLVGVSPLKAGDQFSDVVGTAELAQSAYTNAIWNASHVAPTEDDENVYKNEIWVKPECFTGARRGNYIIRVSPGALEIKAGEPLFKVNLEKKLNWNTGLYDLSLTIKNEGDSEVEANYDYWVELKAGEPTNFVQTITIDNRYTQMVTNHVERSYYLDLNGKYPSGTMSNGCDFVNLTVPVKAALKEVGNKDEIFDIDEEIKLEKVVSVYHWKRMDPIKFIDVSSNEFVVAGRLYSPADTDENFIVTQAELDSVESLLGKDSKEYLKASRLNGEPYYYWNKREDDWTVPSDLEP